MLLGNFVGCGSNPLIRKDALLAIGLYAEHLRGGEDQLLYFELAQKYDFDCVPEYLVGYRASEKSASHNLQAMWQGQVSLFDRARSIGQKDITLTLPWAKATAAFWIFRRAISNRSPGSATMGAAGFFTAMVDAAKSGHFWCLSRAWVKWLLKSARHRFNSSHSQTNKQSFFEAPTLVVSFTPESPRNHLVELIKQCSKSA